MTTDSDELHDDGRLLMAQLEQIADALQPDEREAFAVTMTTALGQATVLAQAAVDPRRVLSAATNVQLLLWASTRTGSPALATALVEAARAHAALWGRQAQEARFRQQLDTEGPPWDAWGASEGL